MRWCRSDSTTPVSDCLATVHRDLDTSQSPVEAKFEIADRPICCDPFWRVRLVEDGRAKTGSNRRLGSLLLGVETAEQATQAS